MAKKIERKDVIVFDSTRPNNILSVKPFENLKSFEKAIPVMRNKINEIKAESTNAIMSKNSPYYILKKISYQMFLQTNDNQFKVAETGK